MVSGESHRRLTEYSLNLIREINKGSIFYQARQDIIDEVAEPDNYRDLEFVDVESLQYSGGRDDPHVKTVADNDDVPRYDTQGFIFAAFNHYIDIRKGPGLFDDYDGYSYMKGSASRNQYQNAWDAKDDWKIELVAKLTGHKKVDDGIAYWFNDEYVHAPGMKWYRGCSPSIERYSFPRDKKTYATVEDEAVARFPLADSTGKSGKGIPYSVFLPLDNLARYWYIVFLYANPGKMNVPALFAPVLHAIQDAIVPHHGAGCNGNWHNRWENTFEENLETWLSQEEFKRDAQALYVGWRQNRIPAPIPLKPDDWKQAPSINWTIDQLVTWLAICSCREYEHTYNLFKDGYKVDLDCCKRMARTATAMALLVYDKAVEDIAGRALAAATGKKEALGQVILRAHNYPTRYILAVESAAKIAELRSYQDKNAARLRMTFGQSDGTCVSLESVDRPGFFLRHRDFVVRMEKYQDNDLFRKDSTFKPRPGLADRMCLSFESVNYPNHYIRHRNFNLYLDKFPAEPAKISLFNADATFMPIVR